MNRGNCFPSTENRGTVECTAENSAAFFRPENGDQKPKNHFTNIQSIFCIILFLEKYCALFRALQKIANGLEEK